MAGEEEQTSLVEEAEEESIDRRPEEKFMDEMLERTGYEFYVLPSLGIKSSKM